MPPTSCKAHIKDYCANCTFAGVHYIADDTKHWTERRKMRQIICIWTATSIILEHDKIYNRWLWLALVALGWYGSAILIIMAWNAFLTSPISFGVETTYLNWDTKMPTVAICEEYNEQRVFDVSDEIWTPSHIPDLDDVLGEIAYFRGSLFRTYDFCFKRDKDHVCPQNNFSYFANLVRSKCHQTLSSCSYNGHNFSCCEYFQQIPTDVGTCFILNSIQTLKPKPYPMINNKTTKKGLIRLEVLVPSKVYTLGEDEIPSVTTSKSTTIDIRLGQRLRRHVAVRNIENDPLVTETTREQRACQFPAENEDGLYPRYSYSACTVLCRKRAQMKFCGCNDHLMPGSVEEEHCNMTGLGCLAIHFSHLTTLKPRWARRPGLACNCHPSCDETEITVIKNEETWDTRLKKQKRSVVEILLAYLPTERFKRNVVRSRLDLVVSVGGTTGLFVGASILSFVELVFYFTIRYIGNVFIEKRKQNTSNKAAEDDLMNYADDMGGLTTITQNGGRVKDSRILHNKYFPTKIASVI